MTDGFKPLPEPMTFREMIRDWWTALPSQRWACRAAGLFVLAWTFARQRARLILPVVILPSVG